MSQWYFKRLHNYSDCCARTGWQDYENWNVIQKLFGFFFFLFPLVVWGCTATWMVTVRREVSEEGEKYVIPDPLFLLLLKAQRKDIQPPDFHHSWFPWWPSLMVPSTLQGVFWHKRSVSQLWCHGGKTKHHPKALCTWGSSYQTFHDNREQQHSPCWEPLCPFWGSA